jgi:hypothetical protein
MEFDDHGMFSWLEIFGHKDADFDFVIIDFLVGGAVDVEAIEAGRGCGVVEGSHDWRMEV